MITSSRRVFLGGLGSSMLAIGLAPALGRRSGLKLDAVPLDDLTFGELEPLAALMQETPPGELQRILVEKLRGGLDLRRVVAAAALANARAFGGEDYTGYHCQMALMPAWEMSRQLPETERPLPVLKVVYRNSDWIQQGGGRASEVLHALPEPEPLGRDGREEAVRRLVAAYRARDVDDAEAALSALARGADARETYDDLLAILFENLDVHRVVLAWRVREALQVTGEEHAETLLRQCVRFCIDHERMRVQRGQPEPPLRTLLPELLERHGLAGGMKGTRRASDDEVDELARVVFGARKREAAEAVAQALGAGLSPSDAGDALSLAANALLLHDPGRRESDARPDKPSGSVHGASVGVHASDAARAWRNIARVASPRHAAACLVAGAYHTGGQGDWVGREPFPYAEHPGEGGEGSEGRGAGRDELLRRTRAAIEAGDQARTCACVDVYGRLGHPERPMFDLLLEHAIDADGALHAEKYYRTVCEDFAEARRAHRWRHLVALGRVTASEHGFEAPGVADARARLGA